jgi:hypothetical protein
LPSEQSGSLAHADQSQTTPLRGQVEPISSIEADSIVLDTCYDLSIPGPQEDSNVAGLRMPHDIGEGFRDDAVDGDFQFRSQLGIS